LKTKPRILIVSSNPPLDEMGGCMIFYRQFVERRDFEVLVLTDRSGIPNPPLPNWMVVEPNPILKRFQRTRFAPQARAFLLLTAGKWIPRGILNAARDFRPDLVYLGPDTAIADLAFGICPEMLEALGPHRNAAVFYPIGNLPLDPPASKPKPEGRPFRLLFAGNLGQWYGRMVLDLAKKLDGHPDIQLVVAGKCANWTPEEENWMIASGMYVGFLKGKEYDALFAAADGLLVCNGFAEEARTIEATNFKSKFVDYLASGLPIFIWAPEGSSSAGFAKREGVGVWISDSSPEAVVQAIMACLPNLNEMPMFREPKWSRLRSLFDSAEVLPKILDKINRLIE
jgi:glycosyltransferase involved in cell wall biosynthesis